MSTAWPARSRRASASCPDGASTTRARAHAGQRPGEQVALVAVVVDHEKAQAVEIDRLRVGSQFDHAAAPGRERPAGGSSPTAAGRRRVPAGDRSTPGVDGFVPGHRALRGADIIRRRCSRQISRSGRFCHGSHGRGILARVNCILRASADRRAGAASTRQRAGFSRKSAASRTWRGRKQGTRCRRRRTAGRPTRPRRVRPRRALRFQRQDVIDDLPRLRVRHLRHGRHVPRAAAVRALLHQGGQRRDAFGSPRYLAATST